MSVTEARRSGGLARNRARACPRLGFGLPAGVGLRLRDAAGAVALTFAFLAPATAAELVPVDPWQVIHVAREFGPAEVASDGMKDPQIRASADGLHYRVTFYGCRLGRDCDTILFDARLSRNEWQAKPPRAKLFAEWNARKLFGRAWVDDEGRAVLDHPVALGPGAPKAMLQATFERWRTALAEFAEHVGVR